MTGLERNLTPKTRPMQKRTALVASLDVGSSKIACMIARLKPSPPNEALRGRSHAVELIGYSQIQSRGVKAGAVVDLAECEKAVRHAVALAERMAKVRVESILLSVSGGRLHGQLIEAAADIRGGSVTSDDISRVTSAGMRHATGEGRTVLHALPVGYALDGVKGIRDPRGMVARQFGVDMNVVTADATVAKNLMLVVERCHLNVEAMAASPYVAGLSILTDDEADLGRGRAPARLERPVGPGRTDSADLDRSGHRQRRTPPAADAASRLAVVRENSRRASAQYAD